ncbi:carboxypeptidase regulatory-like domain-containing protein [uncultured Winogradskyella sp.]|uniref:carboxypeptidase regulatory-like domain-containing protein n=1 Tax=uncultured Winogradskyella sp. TaxID=395353 RepID=UPI002606D209|nr:carboxypeptidase regulatory-like domain-containing protein [uncultured Winogradskyella sp.]|tara:strand:+ start:7543 stop:10332 length:2790 start_codon:yes stop_codon:yes gene_type:complete
MKKSLFILLFGVLSSFTMMAQNTIIKGSVRDAVTLEPIPDVTITIEETQQATLTDGLGEFIFSSNVPLGEQVLKISKTGYVTKRYPIVVNEGKTVNIADMTLDIDITDDADLFTISLSDDELNDDTSGADNISGLLSSSLDVFQRTAAFEFSSSFFKVRGLDSDNGTVLINGIQMNKLYNGRPQWSNWGGLNDVMRNQVLTTGLTPSEYNFGGILGTSNINTRASSYRKGGRITYSSSNRSYTNRAMASYASGLTEGGWSYVFMIGRRWGEEGYQDASLYDSNSFFASIEKKINDKHSVNFTSIYTPNRRGKSSPNTQEVYDLKGIKYNEYWGWLDGEKRNSRIKEVEEPILMLNHYWDISSKTSLNTNVGYQFGKIGNSRLDYPGGANPSPSYYQDLPSYFLADTDGPDYAGAYLAEQEFINDGQIDWENIITANLNNNTGGLNAAYALYEDRNDDKQLTVNTIFTTELNENIILNGSINYKKLDSENFAQIIDLLGSTTGILNVDSFDGFQFDLSNPNRTAYEGDKFRYNYNLYANEISGFAQAQFKYNKVDFFLAANVAKTDYQREGLYDNEANAGNSLGKGDKLEFTGVGVKAGFTYKITGKHLLDINAGYLTKAPSLRNTYTNSRANNDYVGIVNGVSVTGEEITEEKITSFDASYIFRSPIVKAKLTGFYTKIEDANETSFYYADGIGGFTTDDGVIETNALVSEVLQGVDKRHIGGEFGIEAQVTPTIKLKGAASVGQYTYDNNPNLYVSSNSDVSNYGEANLKNYKIAGGPQTAYSVGFEYRDPNYWWFGATANFFSNTYLDVSPILRTENFYLEPTDGLPFNDYDQDVARSLLKQEEFGSYMVVNLVGGKSWKIDNKYIGFFASVGNLLDKEYKTGGFEQGRNANYRELQEDASLSKRRFGPKYWYGRGANYFLNVYLRF